MRREKDSKTQQKSRKNLTFKKEDSEKETD